MNETRVLKKIFQIHKKSLKNQSIKHAKLIICFSGIPCTGKTSIAKIIEKRYLGERISSDNIRRIIKKLGNESFPELLDEKYKETILKKYLCNFVKNYPFKNKLLILDKGIDRDYESVISLARKNKFPVYLIRIIATKQTAEKGVVQKLGKPDKNFVKSIDRWVKEYNAFGKKHRCDLKIKSPFDSPLSAKRLFEKLNKIIKN